MLGAETNAVRVPSAVSAVVPDTETFWRTVVEPVEPFLESVGRRLAEQVETFDPEVAVYARYALGSQGKQLRPALLGLSAGVFGRVEDSAVTAAVIIEMIHLATLVHDDIMDEASLRRSRPTLAANWGNEISVLLGDCLFAHALKLAAGFPTTEVCQAVSAATKTVCSGEILQTLRHQQKNFTRDDYFRILQMRTAEFFALSCDLGAWLGRARGEDREALRQFGLELGIAYQIYDDCLDLFGTESVAGKSLGTDLAGGKVTLPILVVLERAPAPAAKRLRGWLEDWDDRHAAELQQLFWRYKALPEAQAVVHRFLDSACGKLDRLPMGVNRDALAELAHFLAQQTAQLGVQDSA
jgi:octaprenyl-diphosphate synthase